MVGLIAECSLKRSAASIAAVLGVGLLLSSSAAALEAFDGRLQAHGFAEMQIRALDEKFEQQLDLAQWYNVLNVELEFDILPDGWGPIDLLSAYVRVEGRYDCVYKRGCGMFSSADAYGDRAHRVPDRLADGEASDFGGVIEVGQPLRQNPTNTIIPLNGARYANIKTFPQVSCNGVQSPFPTCPPNPNGTPVVGVPTGNSVSLTTADGIVKGEVIDRDPTTLPSGFTPVNGEIIEDQPGRTVRGLFAGLLDQQGADDLPDTLDDPFRYVMSDFLDFGFTFKDVRNGNGAAGANVLGPWLPKNFIESNASLRNKANPFRGRLTPSPAPGVRGFLRYHTADLVINGIGGPDNPNNPYLAMPDMFPSDAVIQSPDGGPLTLLDILPPDLVIPGTTTRGTFLLRNNAPAILTDGTAELFKQVGTNAYGGDFSGIVPCVNADNRQGLLFTDQIQGSTPGHVPQAGCAPDINLRVIGGTGELPLRPAPFVSASAGGFDPTVAQGLYIPSAGLIQYFNEGDFDSLDMNFRESERAWNRGASQQDTKELKEAYVDIEVLDSRLWVRLGLQQIVWGKTELFRTTDQFNPVDLALASLPSLEESRIALNAARFIYSLYEVGPLEDVRLEFAFNFDQNQPADLGACGEPYTIDLVCSLTFGTFAHSYLGLGVAGINRPADPWKDLGGLEIGGRVEWRWDRFSFALTDFYGYDDFPTIESIMTFERNVDIESGRPLITRFNPENARGTCRNDTAVDANGLPLNRQLSSVTVAGIGTDPDCLKFGAPGADSPQNALQFHHANQQVFAWVCAVTVGIAAGLDPGACASTLFSSAENIQVLNIPFSEVITALTAADYRTNSFFSTISNATSGSPLPASTVTPTQALNRDANDGFINVLFGTNMDCGGGVGGPAAQGCGNGSFSTNGFINQLPTIGFTNTNADGAPAGNLFAKWLPSRDDFMTLDSTLTNEQRALLGCGPFWGTRCDSSASALDFDCTGQAGCQDVALTRALFFDQVTPGSLQRGGGIDLLNMEGSALVQAWGGVEGTQPGYVAVSMAQAPGTINFQGGPVCTRYVPGQAKPIVLPGCRGIDSFVITDSEVIFTFQDNYDPTVDGCLVAPNIGSGANLHTVRTVYGDGTDFTNSAGMMSCFGQLAPQTGDFDPNGPVPSTYTPCSNFQNDAACQAQIAEFLNKANSDSSRGTYQSASRPNEPIYIVNFQNASTLYHPLAGCLDADQIALQIAARPTLGPRCNSKPIIPGLLNQSPTPVECQVIVPGCQFRPAEGGFFLPASAGGEIARDYDAEFLIGEAQIFKNELAAVSWNFGLFLVVASGCDDEIERDQNPACFDGEKPFALDRCSFNQMYQCSAIKGILGLVGVQRNVVKAGGNGTYGRRTLLWHGGQEVVLNYNKNNVFGFSTDFAEDYTKSSWGIEFTWFESVPFGNNDEFDNSKSVDTLNLTVSADRPTFINFLNANRTFFFNSQWFFRYVNGHSHGTTGDEWDVLFTFAMFTGYFQDRLNPSLVTIYDFNSESGGVLTSINYRFTEAFSATMGISLFFGQTELNDMPVNPIGPPVNRAGPNAYKDPGERFISNIRKRDEAWLRLRWTF